MLSKESIRVLLYGIIASFGTYFCMYAFRKPFTVATFEGLEFFNVDYKILLIIAQVLGYMSAKFIGIKLISELKNNKRMTYLISLIVFAELSLLFFALVPAPINILFMFTNGLSLGMVWGLVFSYLEGRKFTEFLSMALCASFIVSSGSVKSVGLFLMNTFHTSEIWMPVLTGALFLVPFIGCVFLLEKIPPPSTEDKLKQLDRVPMSALDRKELLKRFFWPLLVLICFYTALTVLRDFRDNFAREIWDATNFAGSASIFTWSEVPIAILVLLILGATGFVKNNKKAFYIYHILLLLGALIIGTTTFLFQQNILPALYWISSVGFGLYICYVPFNGIFYNRMIAAFKIKGNAGFLIYLGDAIGYLGSMLVLLYKNFGQKELAWIQFFSYASYSIAVLGVLAVCFSWWYFKNDKKVDSPIPEINLANA